MTQTTRTKIHFRHPVKNWSIHIQ